MLSVVAIVPALQWAAKRDRAHRIVNGPVRHDHAGLFIIVAALTAIPAFVCALTRPRVLGWIVLLACLLLGCVCELVVSAAPDPWFR